MSITPFAKFTEAYDQACVPLPGLIPQHVRFSNVSEAALRVLGRKYLKQHEVLNQAILLEAKVQKWELKDGRAIKVVTCSFFTQSIISGSFKTERLDAEAASTQKFSTTNIPEIDCGASFRSSEALNLIKSALFKTAPLLENPEKYEWRFDINNYSEDELNEIIVRLRERGFVVSAILPSQIKVEDSRRKVRLSSAQYLCIAFPPFSDHSYQLEPSEKNFSAYQIYQTWGRIKERKSFAPRTQSVDYVLRGIEAELQMIMKESSLFMNYPVDVACLKPEDRLNLISILTNCGYKVHVGREKPFFQIGMMDLVQSSQEILIDLSRNQE